MTTLESSILKTIQCSMLFIFRYILRNKGRVIRKNHISSIHSQELKYRRIFDF